MEQNYCGRKNYVKNALLTKESGNIYHLHVSMQRRGNTSGGKRIFFHCFFKILWFNKTLLPLAYPDDFYPP